MIAPRVLRPTGELPTHLAPRAPPLPSRPFDYPLSRFRPPTNSPRRANWRPAPLGPPSGVAPAPDGPRQTARRPPPPGQDTGARLRRGAA
ncbi:hypothetical protein N7475_001064 [Penicillium sp. IBT 31633x]|nr:hypothetical protein N7475_001064 [Penicillium sp. IBT 31633x]